MRSIMKAALVALGLLASLETQAVACGSSGTRPVNPLTIQVISSNRDVADKALQQILSTQGLGIEFLEKEQANLQLIISVVSEDVRHEEYVIAKHINRLNRWTPQEIKQGQALISDLKTELAARKAQSVDLDQLTKRVKLILFASQRSE